MTATAATATGRWEELPLLDLITALTVRQPYVAAILGGPKRVENRTWLPYGHDQRRGWLWLHEAGQASVPGRQVVADLGHPWYAEVPCRPGIVAAISIADTICDAARPHPDHPHALCGCGEWAMPGHYHWRIVDVWPLPHRVPCVGALGLWRPEQHILDQIRDQITTSPERHPA